MLTEADVINRWTIIAFSCSTVISIIILVLYFRKYGKKAGGKDGGQKRVSIAAAPPRTSSPRTSSLVSRRSASSARRLPTSRSIGDDWGPLAALGVDLGSYETKTFVFEEGKLKLHSAQRSIVTVYNEGFRFGEVDFAKEYADKTFFSITRDMAIGADVQITVGEVTVKPYQAQAMMLKWIIGDRPRAPPLAISVPPYLNNYCTDLYLAAMAAKISRFFIFKQSAALLAALLRTRRLEPSKTKPARHVVFVDCGRSGISAYFCEVRETAASVRRECFRFAGVQEMERLMVEDLSKNLSEEDRADPYIMAAIVEAAAELRYDFASTPAYLLSTAKKSSRTNVTENISVEMDRERFMEIVEQAKSDAQEVADEIMGWLRAEGAETQCELILTGNGFKLRELRAIFELLTTWRGVQKDKISIAQGLALLAAMRHPRYNEQRFDIDPLYEQLTLDDSGVRPRIEDETGRASILSPLLGARNSFSTFASGSTRKRGSTNQSLMV